MNAAPPQLIPLDAPTLVEASAGTGKTYTITTYFVRAILERDLKPDEILVVTYTKAATAELRARTRQRILDAIRLLDVGSEAGDVLQGVVTASVERVGRRETEMKLRAALGEMDRAAILTIHGFCQRLLQDHPLLFGIDFDFEVSEDARSMYSELAVDYWTAELYDAPDWMLRALGEKKVNAAQLAKLAKVSVTPGIEILGPAPAEVDQAILEQWALFKKKAAELWSTDRGEVVEILTNDEGLSRTYYKQETIANKWLSALDAFFAKSGFTYPPDFLPRLAQGRLKMKKGCEEPRHRFFEACAALWEAQESLVPAFDFAVFRFRERFIEFARMQTKRRREDRAVLTYDDLLTLVYSPFDTSSGASAAFDRDKIAEEVSKTYRLALIDEFQDTDGVQYGIFSAIYGESSVVYVGDPKQAIYAFRGADVFSYIGAVRDVGDRVHTLTTNRRSDAGVVRAVNTLFSLRTPPFILEGIDMNAAIPHHEERRTTLEPSMEVVFLTADQLKGGVAAAVAPVVANEIALLLESDAQVEGRPVEPGDIAVLCRSNSQALAVTDALRELNVPVSLDGGSSVLGTEIASDLSAVLAATLMPGDSSLIRRALLTSLLGVSPYGLATMSDEKWSEWASRLRHWSDLWHGQGVVRFLEEMLRSTQAEARIAKRPSARRVLTDLLHIEEVLLRGERERSRNPAALMQWFRRLGEDSPGDGTMAPEDLQQRPDADAGAVRVATIHKSKGLEYGIVYCPFPWVRLRSEVAVKFHDEHGNIKFDLGSEHWEAHQEASRREEFSEAVRLLYVAVTRAKYRCTLYWGRVTGWKNAALGYLLHGSEAVARLDEDGMRDGVEEFVVNASGTAGWRFTHDERAAPREHDVPRLVLAAREQKRYFSQAARIASFTSLTGHDEKTPGPRPATALVQREPSLFEDLPGGVRTGLFLHSVLEDVDFQKLDAIETEQLIACQLHAFGFDTALTPGVQRDLHAVAATPFADRPGAPRLIDLSRDVQLRELEFTLHGNRAKLPDLAEILNQHGAPVATPRYHERLAEVSGQTLQRFLRGYIDLMFEWEGRWYVADYKSNTLPTYEADAINEAVQRTHYLLQAQLYTAAAHRYLKQRVAGYDPETQWGGALFLFLRGMRGPQSAGSSVFFDRQPAELLRSVDRWLGGADESL
jgi:exodeoxyribonuclease V beta subunit